MIERKWAREDEDFAEVALDAAKREAEIQTLTTARRFSLRIAMAMILVCVVQVILIMHRDKSDYAPASAPYVYVFIMYLIMRAEITGLKIKLLKTIERFTQTRRES